MSLESKDAKEKNDADSLKKNMEKFEFIVFIVIWERLLLAINSSSGALQKIDTDLSASTRLLSMASNELSYLHNSWESIIMTAKALASVWKIAPHFTVARKRRTKKFFDELSSDQRLQDPEMAFKVHVFYNIVDTAASQLQSRFVGQRLVTELFSFLFPSSLLQLSDADLELAAAKLQQKYFEDIGPNFVSELRSFRCSFCVELQTMKTVLDILKLLVDSHIMSSVPELATACVLFVTLPVTVASAERSFSKLKLIKTFLRSTLSQEQLDGLALISIENKSAKELDIDNIIDTFANNKARKSKLL